MKIRYMFTTIALVATFVVAPLVQAGDLTPAEARVIAKEAYIYGYPLVDNYRIQYAYYVDKNNSQYMAPSSSKSPSVWPLTSRTGFGSAIADPTR